jgi:hypothetical protein
MEIRFVLANGMFKMKIDIDRHGSRPMPNNCKNFNPPNFSLPTTFQNTLFKKKKILFMNLIFLILYIEAKLKLPPFFSRSWS